MSYQTKQKKLLYAKKGQISTPSEVNLHGVNIWDKVGLNFF